MSIDYRRRILFLITCLLFVVVLPSCMTTNNDVEPQAEMEEIDLVDTTIIEERPNEVIEEEYLEPERELESNNTMFKIVNTGDMFGEINVGYAGIYQPQTQEAGTRTDEDHSAKTPHTQIPDCGFEFASFMPLSEEKTSTGVNYRTPQKHSYKELFANNVSEPIIIDWLPNQDELLLVNVDPEDGRSISYQLLNLDTDDIKFFHPYDVNGADVSVNNAIWHPQSNSIIYRGENTYSLNVDDEVSILLNEQFRSLHFDTNPNTGNLTVMLANSIPSIIFQLDVENLTLDRISHYPSYFFEGRMATERMTWSPSSNEFIIHNSVNHRQDIGVILASTDGEHCKVDLNPEYEAKTDEEGRSITIESAWSPNGRYILLDSILVDERDKYITDTRTLSLIDLQEMKVMFDILPVGSMYRSPQNGYGLSWNPQKSVPLLLGKIGSPNSYESDNGQQLDIYEIDIENWRIEQIPFDEAFSNLRSRIVWNGEGSQFAVLCDGICLVDVE